MWGVSEVRVVGMRWEMEMVVEIGAAVKMNVSCVCVVSLSVNLSVYFMFGKG